MDKKLRKKLLKMEKAELRAFVLERRDTGDYAKLEAQAYALDLLVEEAFDEGRREGKYEVVRLF